MQLFKHMNKNSTVKEHGEIVFHTATNSKTNHTLLHRQSSSDSRPFPKPRRAYHPPLLSAHLPPVGIHSEYVMGQTGPQGFGCAGFYVAQIPSREARAVITAHHYSRRAVNNSYIHLGVFREGAMEGVLQFGYALNPARAGKVVRDTVQGQYLELNRMWLSDAAPRNSESRAISYAVKFIRRACPSVAWIQSFADERCGGLGVVYQASNFLYLGSHQTTFYVLDGEIYHKILATTDRKGGGRGEYLRANLHRAEKQTLRQFRYIYFIKTDWQKRLNMAVQPYPKRNP